MSVLEEDYLHKFASERFALASATERLSERSMRSEFARMADHQRANRNSKRNESSSSTGMLFLQKENQDPCIYKDPGDFRAVLMRQLLSNIIFSFSTWLLNIPITFPIQFRFAALQTASCTVYNNYLFGQGVLHGYRFR